MREGRGIRPIVLAATVTIGLASTVDTAAAQGALSPTGSGTTGNLLTPGSLFSNSLFPQSSLFPSSLLPASGLFPNSLLPQSGLFSNSLFPQSSLFPSSLLPTSGLFPNSLLPQSGLFSNSLVPQSSLFPTFPTGSSMFSTSTLFPQNSLFPTLLQSNVYSTTLPGSSQSFGGFLPPIRVISLGSGPSAGEAPPLGGQLVTLGGDFTGMAQLPTSGTGGSSAGGTTSVPVQGTFSAQGTLPQGTVLGNIQGVTITPSGGVLKAAPPTAQNPPQLLGLSQPITVAPPMDLLGEDTLLADLLFGRDLSSFRDLLGGDGGFGFGLGDFGFRDLGSFDGLHFNGDHHSGGHHHH